MMLTLNEMKKTLNSLEIEPNSILLVHSSLKALGHIEGGAEAVIEALESVVSKGTLVMPTLSQKNWDTVFQDWHMDRPSDTGLITETFRKQEGSVRSDNPTHSVAARGVHANDIVSGDPLGGARYGLFGDYCFSHESPWQRMYDSRTRYGVKAYVLFWGVSMKYHTYKHFCEYRLVEDALASIPNETRRNELKLELAHYPYEGGANLVWPFYDSNRFCVELEKMKIAKRSTLGSGDIICCDIFDCVNATDKAIRSDPESWMLPPGLKWYKKTQESK